MTAKKSVAAVTTEVFDLLHSLDADERQRAIAAVQMLLGAPSQTPVAPGGFVSPGTPSVANLQGRGLTAQAYFAEKQPRSVSEALAVAARFSELTSDSMEHTKEQFAAVYKTARRSFDSRNFARDIGNARTSGYFTKGKDIALSDYGQRYVDALPDRPAAQGLRRGKPGKKAKKKRT
jgi:hypothetical protein